jgi:hypothetical protein
MRERVMMPKTATKKPTSKTIAAALKAMENMVFETADVDVQLKQVKERLNAAGMNVDIGPIALAGRNSSGSGMVQINIGLGGYSSIWPEWAYGVAEGALHFNRQVLIVYNNVPSGNNLLAAYCT